MYFVFSLTSFLFSRNGNGRDCEKNRTTENADQVLDPIIGELHTNLPSNAKKQTKQNKETSYSMHLCPFLQKNLHPICLSGTTGCGGKKTSGQRNEVIARTRMVRLPLLHRSRQQSLTSSGAKLDLPNQLGEMSGMILGKGTSNPECRGNFAFLSSETFSTDRNKREN